MTAQVCSLCNGTGWKPVEPALPAGGQEGARRVVRCDCVAQARPAELLAAARIPPQFAHCDFESFAVRSVFPDKPQFERSLEEAKLVAERFAAECPVNVDCGLLLSGPPGVGKTHLAVAVLRRLIEKGMQGIFYDYQELLKQIQHSYNPAAETSELAILDPILAAEVLLLDDLGSLKPSLWVLDTVGYIINQRYSHKRITLLTTNYPDALPGAARGERGPALLPDTLAMRIGERMRSRLFEMCRGIEIQSEDFRRHVKQARYGFS